MNETLRRKAGKFPMMLYEELSNLLCGKTLETAELTQFSYLYKCGSCCDFFVRVVMVCDSTHVRLHMLIIHVLVSKSLFLVNKYNELIVLSLFWPLNCIKLRKHVPPLSGPTVPILWPGVEVLKGKAASFALTFSNRVSTCLKPLPR